MKRKIAKIGPSTLMVSLPSKWVKTHNLGKGDEIELKQEKNQIILTTQKKLQATKTTIDITNMPSTLIWHTIKSVYRQGTDEIKVFFKNEKIKEKKSEKVMNTRELIQIISNQLIGMEIIKEEKNYCILKEISEIKEQEFENILNRTFISILNLTETSIEAIKNKDKQTLENIFMFTDQNINKFTDFCMRILNKIQYKNTNSYYLIVVYLEEIGDHLIRIIQNLYKTPNKETIERYKEINEALKLLYKSYYTFNKDNLLLFYEKRNQIRKKLQKKDDSIVSMKIILNFMMEIINCKTTINHAANS